jgi:hypothetical protein
MCLWLLFGIIMMFDSQTNPPQWSPSVPVPCRDGVSHHWDEYASQAQIEKGIRTLADALAKLAGSCAADSETAPRAEQEDL